MVFSDDLLRFGDSPIGYVTVVPPVDRKEGFAPLVSPLFCRKAVGEISIPGDSLLGLELIGSQIADPSILRSQTLPQQTSILTVSQAQFGQEHMEVFGKLYKLTQITFEQCQFSENAFDSLPCFPQLKSCTVRFDDFDHKIEQSFMRWVSQQEKLEQLVVMPQISSDAISILSHLPNLKAIYANLDANATATLTALKQLRQMEHLNVSVTAAPSAPNCTIERVKYTKNSMP